MMCSDGNGHDPDKQYRLDCVAIYREQHVYGVPDQRHYVRPAVDSTTDVRDLRLRALYAVGHRVHRDAIYWA